MALTDVLLVTRNYKGVCEENFLSTVNEFLDKYCVADNPKDVDMLRSVVLASEPYKWVDSYYVSPDESYDMRLCQGSEDLLNFLSGEYNDSVEKMEARNPGTCGIYKFWYAENRFDMFSPLAIEEVSRYASERACEGKDFMDKVRNAVPGFSPSTTAVKHNSLADMIKAAQNMRSLGSDVRATSSFLER